MKASNSNPHRNYPPLYYLILRDELGLETERKCENQIQTQKMLTCTCEWVRLRSGWTLRDGGESVIGDCALQAFKGFFVLFFSLKGFNNKKKIK